MNRGLLATCWTSAGNVSPADAGQMSPVPIEQRIRAVAEAGWDGMGLLHTDLAGIHDGRGFDGLQALLRGAGLHTLELEFLTDWWTDGQRRAASDDTRRLLLDATAALGVRVVKIAPDLSGRQALDARFVDEFGRLAEQFAERGAVVALEQMPFSSLGTLSEAAAVIAAVGHPAAGLALDAWHVAQSGAAVHEITGTVPTERIYLAELADGIRVPRENWATSAFGDRRLPGEGDFDNAGFVAALTDAGYDGYWGVEIMSDDFRRRTPADALHAAHAAARAVLDDADHRRHAPRSE